MYVLYSAVHFHTFVFASFFKPSFLCAACRLYWNVRSSKTERKNIIHWWVGVLVKRKEHQEERTNNERGVGFKLKLVGG
ncbi:hypothetical protein I7I50_04407 [Histoplasma capsulatum G186AR]|uniref:Uncharacterized protein n=1 Tax=Ajellomyces capsulatus TaxID=5037 RepID=A0A8H8CXY2_AJECA|nr:hypothetical protein I7I52_05315 [Histoplasma capsulatum]QSS75306.1 hypothetical protein I7I50_04407 [Histoplasma capsulatum G186AR]